MRFIQYSDGQDEIGNIACSVAAYSARLNGNLPDCEYVFYTPNWKEIQNKPYARKAFDSIEPAPEIVEYTIYRLPGCNQWIKRKHRAYNCWKKFLCFLFEEGDVFFTDWDTVCIGDISEAVPTGKYLISGRKAVNKGRVHNVFNGGVLAKVSKLNYSPAWRIMLDSLLDKDSWITAHRNWRWDDEAATWWLWHLTDGKEMLALDWKFNLFANEANRRSNLDDIRIIHYMGRYKPWSETCPYEHLKQIWRSYQDQLF